MQPIEDDEDRCLHADYANDEQNRTRTCCTRVKVAVLERVQKLGAIGRTLKRPSTKVERGSTFKSARLKGQGQCGCCMKMLGRNRTEIQHNILFQLSRSKKMRLVATMTPQLVGNKRRRSQATTIAPAITRHRSIF